MPHPRAVIPVSTKIGRLPSCLAQLVCDILLGAVRELKSSEYPFCFEVNDSCLLYIDIVMGGVLVS